ncbi:hypothetical protein HC928_08840 [bacterium]|nr:hypothetical protein [bacterium]
MTRYSPPGLLTPPREDEDIYPYSRVWPVILVLVGLLFGLSASLLVAYSFIGLRFSPLLTRPINVIIALLPLLIWLGAAWLRDRSVPRPRERLLAVCIISALVANAVTLPFIEDTLKPAEWLSLASLIDRIIGYTLTVGMLQEGAKYMVLRVLVWPDYLRNRYDMLAYGLASSVGYATVFGLRAATGEAISPDIFAGQIFFIVSLHISANGIVSYGLSELHFNPQSLILLPVTLLLASSIIGLALTLRANFLNSGFALGIATPNLLLGLLFSLAITVTLIAILGFIYNTAERRQQEAYTVEEV